MNLNDIRQEYLQEELEIDSLHINPIEQLQKWFNQAATAKIDYVNAANLATVNAEGVPSNRIVLIKEITQNGVVFYTDFRSEKAMNIAQNKNVCINLFWKEFDRQIRMVGTARKLDFETNKKYFQSRPKESQISATASIQSSPVSKENLYKAVDLISSEYQLEDVLPCPENWGGYEIEIKEFEFWQGRPNRLHDRFKYTQNKNEWKIIRLAP